MCLFVSLFSSLFIHSIVILVQSMFICSTLKEGVMLLPVLSSSSGLGSLHAQVSQCVCVVFGVCLHCEQKNTFIDMTRFLCFDILTSAHEVTH